MRRTTISLSDDHERALVKFGQPGPYRDELRSWARDRGIDLSDSPAEAALVRVLIDAGIEHIRAYSADVAYRELAEVYADEGITGEVAAMGGEALGDESPGGGAPGAALAGVAPAGVVPAGVVRAATQAAGHAHGGRRAAG